MPTNEVIVNGQTLISLRADTVAPEYVKEGITFHDRTGASKVGVLASGPVLLVTVTGQTATSVTATLGNKSVSLAYNSTIGKWWAELPGTGTWTVTATGGGKTASTTVSATAVTIYEATVTLSRLPSGYTELEYIESTGTQYINTGARVTSSINTFTFSVMFLSNSDARWFGGYNNILAYKNGLIPVRIGGTWNDSYAALLSLNQKINVELVTTANGYTLSTDRVTQQILSGRTVTTDGYDLYLFAVAAEVAVGKPQLRVYKYSQSSNNALVRDMIPAKRTSDNAIGMYDLVGKKWYGNAGTGVFTAGPVVS